MIENRKTAILTAKVKNKIIFFLLLPLSNSFNILDETNELKDLDLNPAKRSKQNGRKNIN